MSTTEVPAVAATAASASAATATPEAIAASFGSDDEAKALAAAMGGSAVAATSEAQSEADRERDEYLKTGQGLREEGNKLFKEGDYKKALTKYTKVFLWVNGLNSGGIAEVMAANDGARGPTPPATGVNGVIRELRVSTNLNCSVCYLKLGDTTRAVDFAQRAVDLDSENKKSVYRRGQALLAKGELDGAQRDLNIAAVAFPADKGVKEDIKKLAEKFKAITQKERAQFAGIFDRKPAKAATTTATPAPSSSVAATGAPAVASTTATSAAPSAAAAAAAVPVASS